jgi:hypothetical protein
MSPNTVDQSDASPLIAVYPEWKQLVQTELDSGGHPYVVVEFEPPPTADVEGTFLVTTVGDEVSVHFDAFHSHFDDWSGEVESALTFIQELVSEQIAIVSWWDGDEWRGSSYIQAGAKLELPTWSGAQTITRIRVRSWKGSLNADVDV